MSGRPYNGRLAGLVFRDGEVAERDVAHLSEVERQEKLRAVLGYARRHGLVVDGDGRLVVPDQEVAEPADPRTVEGVHHGRLRDGAVDPRPGDFLGPTNAGQANPHGPDVVNPEVHASEGVRPVRPGDVSVGHPARQDAAETAHTANPLAGTARDTDPAPSPAVDPPKGNASHDAWVDHAVNHGGLDRATAEAMTRDELRQAFGPKED